MSETKMLYLLFWAEIFHADSFIDELQFRGKSSQISFDLLFGGYL